MNIIPLGGLRGARTAVYTDASASGTVNLDASHYAAMDITETGNVTFTFSGATAGYLAQFILYLFQDGTGSRTTTWPGSVSWIGGTPPALNTAPDALNVLTFQSMDGGATWYGSLITEVSFPLPISKGGTSSTTAANALIALGGSGAGFTPNVTYVSANYVTLATDFLIEAAPTAANMTITLTPAQGRVYVIKNTGTAGYTVTLSPVSGTIDGQATVTLSYQHDWLMIQWDSSNWVQLAGNYLLNVMEVLGNGIINSYTQFGAKIKVSGLTEIGAGSSTSDSAPVLTSIGAVSGTALQLSDTARDYIVYLECTTSGTATSISMGPTSAASSVTILSSVSVTAGGLYSFRLPAGWYFKWTGTTTAFGNQNAVGC